jgi:hypothetical protein
MYKQDKRVNVQPGVCRLRDTARSYTFSLITQVHFPGLARKQKLVSSRQIGVPRQLNLLYRKSPKIRSSTVHTSLKPQTKD